MTPSVIALKEIIWFDNTQEPSQRRSSTGKKYQPRGPNYSPRCISFSSWMPDIRRLEKQLHAPVFGLAGAPSSSHTPVMCWLLLHSDCCPAEVQGCEERLPQPLSSSKSKARHFLWDMDRARARSLQPFSKGYLDIAPSWKMALCSELLSKEIAS